MTGNEWKFYRREKLIDRYCEMVKKTIADNGGERARVVLATYTEEEYAELHRMKNTCELTWTEHLELIAGVAAGVTRAFPQVEVVFQPIEAAEYWRWLAAHNAEDNAGARAACALEKYERLHPDGE